LTSTPPKIPICPAPLAKECLSSWIERTACFYGCDLDRWLWQFSVALNTDRALDLDLSMELRAMLSEWTGISFNRIPRLADPSTVLPNGARLAFCEQCWDEDVRTGNQPYVRCHWLNWTTVHCCRHREFLSAKNRSVDAHAPHRTWQEVWACKPSWRDALELQAHGAGVWKLCYTMPKRLPECSQSFMDSLERLANPSDVAASQALGQVFQTWRRSLEQRDRNVELPVLLENRIEILAQAAELLRS
jgi:hypothetical protein